MQDTGTPSHPDHWETETPKENVVGPCQCLAARGQGQEILQPLAPALWLQSGGDRKAEVRGLGGPYPGGCIEIARPDPGGL